MTRNAMQDKAGKAVAEAIVASLSPACGPDFRARVWYEARTALRLLAAVNLTGNEARAATLYEAWTLDRGARS